MNKRIIAFALAAVFAVSMAGPVQATTAADLQALIDSLTQQIATLQIQIAGLSGGVTTTGLCVSEGLKYGMTSDAVKTLQEGLKQDVTVYPEGLTTGYFGPLTKAAVIRFQEKYASEILASWGYSKGTGYVGPTTSAKFNSLYCIPVEIPPVAGTFPEGCTSAEGFSSTTGLSCSATVSYPEGCTSTEGYSPVTGESCSGTTTTVVAPSEGYFTYKLLPTPTNGTDVKKGDVDKAIMSFTLKANNSAINVSRVQLNFNKRPWLNVSKVSFYEGSNLVKGVEATSSAFEEVTVGSSYNLHLTGLGISIPSGETKTFTVKVDVSSSPAATDLTQVQLAINAIRGVDSVDLNVYAPGTASARTFTVGASAHGYIDVSLDASSPVQGTSFVSDTETTENVVLGQFKLKATHRDVRVTALKFQFVGITSSDMDTVLSAAKLYDGTTALASEALATDASTTTGSVSFTLLDIPISKDSTKVLTVKANVAKIATSYTVKGDYVHAVLDGTAVANITAEDNLYYTLVDAELDGTATAEDQYFYKVGPTFTFINDATAIRSDSTSSTSGDVGDFTINFTVTANGGDIYLPTVNHATYGGNKGSATGLFEKVSNSGGTETATTSNWTCVGTSVLDDDTTNKVWGIQSGVSRQCTYNYHEVNTSANAYYSLGLTNIHWSTTAPIAADNYTAQTWGINTLKTPTILLQK